MSYNTAKRRRFTKKQRASFLIKHGCQCHWCKQPILPSQPWAIDHLFPREMMPDGEADADENLGPIHAHPLLCHKQKTAQDVAMIAKSNAIRVRHGLQESKRKKPKPKMRTRGFDKTRTRKMNGQVVTR